MKTFFASLASLAALVSLADSANVPVTFTLSVDPAGTALQFDVQSSRPLSSVGTPTFSGVSAHAVKSARLASGVHRVVVYSTTGAAISADGEVKVSFASGFPLANGSFSIGNVVASNSIGGLVTSSPNALPTLSSERLAHRSVEIGETFFVRDAVVDLDGSVASVRLLSDAAQVDEAAAAPFYLDWGPIASGTFALSLSATDNRGQTALIDFGSLRGFALSDITDYASFASVHYGSGAAVTVTDLNRDPLGIGIGNGIAFLLGLNPHSPDARRLPRASLEEVGSDTHLVVRFAKRSSIGSLQWEARQSIALTESTLIGAEFIEESDAVDGMNEVEIRLPMSGDVPGSRFVNLKVSSE